MVGCPEGVALIFSIQRMTLGYQGKPALLNNVSLDIPRGSTVALLGPSGCGKSTLLNLLGLLWEAPLSQGEIVYHGKTTPITYSSLASKRQDRNELRSTEFGFVLQSCYLLPHFTGLENIAMPLMLRGWDLASACQEAERLITIVQELTESIGFREAAAKTPATMSGGEKQRIAVLRSIIGGPRVVFADEPSSNLDARNTVAFLNLLTQWRKGEIDQQTQLGRTLLLVCHHQETAYAYADWFALIDPKKQGLLFFPKADWPLHQEHIRQILNPLNTQTS